LAFEILEDRWLLSAVPDLALTGGAVVSNAAAAPTGLTPMQIRDAYGFDQIRFGSIFGNGSGQTIAIIDAYNDPNIQGDLQVFDAQFGLPNPPSFTVVAQDGTQNLPRTDPAGAIYQSGLNSSWSLEESLDVEWAHALAPGANIVLVEATSSSVADMQTAVSFAASYPGVSVVSMSFGESEFPGETSDDNVFTTPAGHNGVTFVASTGDLGAPGEYQAFSPNVLSVGGTSLTLGAGNSYGSEIGWSGSGGGISLYEPKPAYQTNINGGNTPSLTNRTTPDVAFDAGTAVSVYDSFDAGPTPQGPNSWYGETGTSFSAPAWAALIAVADQGRVVAGLGTLDGPSQTLPLLYQMPATDFHDVVGGSNGFNASPGYDLVTGRGSPVVNLVVQGLGVPAPPSVLNLSGDADFSGENDTIELQLDAVNPSLLDVYVNSTSPTYQTALASITQINVNGLLGNNTLIVDDSNGLVSIPGGISYNGGSGSNTLEVVSSSSTIQTSDAFTLGSTPGQGTDAITGPAGSQSISFQNSGYVLDTVAATTIRFNGTPAATTLSYGQGSVVGNGLLAIAGQQSLEFSNKATLIINTSAGDQITLDNPNTPAALTQIVVQPTVSTASANVTFGGATGPVTVSMANVAVPGSSTQVTGYSSTVELQGIAVANFDVGGNTLTAIDASSNDTLAVALGGSQSGAFQSAGLGTVFNFSNMAASAGALAVEGGPGSSTLKIQSATGGTLAANQFVVVNPASGNSGTVETYTGGVLWTSFNYQNVPTVLPNVASDNGQPNELFVAADADEPNDSLATATPLVAAPSVQVSGAAILASPSQGAAADVDFYSVVAQQTGTLDVEALFSLFDPAVLPGGGMLNLEALDAAGDVIAAASSGLSAFGVSGAGGNARIRIPAVAGQTYYLEVFGANAGGVPNPAAFNSYSLNVVNTAAPLPYDLQLSRGGSEAGEGPGKSITLPPSAPADDTGASPSDNISNINTPTIFLQLHDSVLLNDSSSGDDAPPVGVIPIPLAADATEPGFQVAIFDGQDASVPVGFATPVGAEYPGLYQYTFTSPLADGTHYITAAVEMIDPSIPAAVGFGGGSRTVLSLTVDTSTPGVYFGTSSTGVSNGLAAGSDSGVAGQPQTLSDRITSVTTPTLFGYAETDSTVDVYALATAGDQAGQEILLGETIATATGTGAPTDGQWSLTTSVDLNDPDYFTRDGTRQLWIVATNLAGTVSSTSPDQAGPGQTFEVFIDTQGPTIGGSVNGSVVPPVQVTTAPSYNLLGASPTPMLPVTELTINIIDPAPHDSADFPSALALITAIAQTPGNYVLTGESVGVMPIQSATVTQQTITADGQVWSTVVLTFNSPSGRSSQLVPNSLFPDQYTLSISDALADTAGNPLDGGNGLSTGGDSTPNSGDGTSGGNFVASFSIYPSGPFVTLPGYANTLFVAGTGGNDTFAVQFTDSTHFNVTLDGLTQSYSTAQYNSINYIGQGGVATASVSGNGQPATANLYVGSFQYIGTGFLITGTGVWTELLSGLSTDTANEFGNASIANTLTASPTAATMSGSGYTNTATGFGHVIANSDNVNDVANLSDTGGTNTFTSTTTSSTASSAAFSGTGFSVVTNNFHQVTATAGSGAQDSAVLNGLVTSNNTFNATPSSSSMQGNGFDYIVNGFTQVQAHAGGLATLSTTSGTNTLVANPASTTLSGMNYSITAYNFALVRAQSGAAANDSATMNDPSGAGTFSAYPTYAVMSAWGGTNQATGFKTVAAVGVAGGSGTANFYDSPSDSDSLSVNNSAAGAQNVTMTLAGPGFNYSINSGFKTLTLNANASGGDSVSLSDSGGTNTFTSTTTSPTASSATFAGTGFSVVTNNYPQVTVNAAASAHDSAVLNGLVTNNNTFNATPSSSSMQGNGFDYIVNGFAQVQAHAGGLATLSTMSGTNTLVTNPASTTLSGANYSITAYNFALVRAQSGAAANDSATMNDPSGAGTFSAYPTYAVMSAWGGTSQATGFKTVAAVGVAGSSGTANFYDSPSESDSLSVNNSAASTQNVTMTLAGSGFNYSINSGFKTLTLNANASGGDSVSLSDSGGTNTFTSTTTSPTASSATFAGTGFSVVTDNYSQVTVNAAASAHDSAVLNGLVTNNNTFNATPSSSSMQGNGFDYIVNGFMQVQAHAGGLATLSTMSGTNTLVTNPASTTLSGANYSITAYNFALVRAQSGAAANDSATMNDPSGAGTFSAYPTYAVMTAWGGTSQATGFKTVAAVGVAGGSGTVNVYDSASGSDTLTFNNTAAGVQSNTMTLVGPGFNYSINFGFKTFNASGSASGNDLAKLFDSSGNDSLFAAGDQLQLAYPNLTLNLNAYKTVAAGSVNGGTDTVTEQTIDYVLQKTGAWVSAVT
jgi:hypothetical protein